jgi:hypothetical protein
MTARARALEWFVEPAAPSGHPAAGAEPGVPSGRPAAGAESGVPSGRPAAGAGFGVRWGRAAAAAKPAAPAGSAVEWLFPVAGGTEPPLAEPSVVSVTVAEPPVARREWLTPGDATLVGVTLDAAARPLTCAAVLGLPGEAEPVAAALALALRRFARAKAATVCVWGANPGPVPAPGAGAARRLATRLAAHGLEAGAKGRLAWVHLPAGEAAALAAARRAAVVAPPVVLAITVPRSAALDELLAEQDLVVIVTADPDGPLARLAASAADVRVLPLRPLPRGPARSLSRAGLRPARSASELVAAAIAGGSG